MGLLKGKFILVSVVGNLYKLKFQLFLAIIKKSI